VLETPVLGLFALLSILDTKRVRLDLAEAVEVELTNERTKVIVLKIFRNYLWV
jgi:hypothetical protein